MPPGCVIAELFTEGVPLFDLSQLLAYRRGNFQTEQVLQKIEDRSIRELVTVTLLTPIHDQSVYSMEAAPLPFNV